MLESHLTFVNAITENSAKAELWHAFVLLRADHMRLVQRQSRIDPLVAVIEEIIDRRMAGENS